MPIIDVHRDFDGYFEKVVRGWYEDMQKRGMTPKADRVIITAGPHRSEAVTCQWQSTDAPCRVLLIDFYSAIRRGFGSLPASDVEIIKREWL